MLSTSAKNGIVSISNEMKKINLMVKIKFTNLMIYIYIYIYAVMLFKIINDVTPYILLNATK